MTPLDILGRINIAILTTAYEIGVDEGAGKRNFDPEQKSWLPYRTSLVESVARALIAGESEFSQRCNLVGIVTNDNRRRHEEAWTGSGPWPRDLELPIREHERLIAAPTLDELTINVPARWALLRAQPGESLHEHSARVAESKRAYEQELAEVFDAMSADLVISYSYTKIVEQTLLERYGGRLLNIHPALLAEGDPQRTPGITPTADHWTRYHHGWIATHRKHAVDHPGGREGSYIVPEGHPAWGADAGRQIPVIHVPSSDRGGVTLHVIEEAVDEGRIILQQEHHFTPEELTMQGIRQRNYAAMHQLVPSGILCYLERESARERIMMGREARAQPRYRCAR